MEDTKYEQERAQTIAENKKLLTSLGFDEGIAATMNLSKPSPPPRSAPKKRKEAPTAEGPRRRSGRIAGFEADSTEIAAKQEAEAVALAEAVEASRKLRKQRMPLGEMLEDADEGEVKELEAFLPTVEPVEREEGKEAYPDKDAESAEVKRLRDQFENMVLRANAKVTSERVYCMAVHPEPSKTLVFVGDKAGQLGIWDALGQSAVKTEEGEGGDADGPIWRVQAHAKNSISCMKVDPAGGQNLYTSAYDCSLRRLDFQTLQSTEVFAFGDEDSLVTHFDLTPTGQEAWVTDKHGGITHVDFREGGERRRWVVQEEGRGAKLGGISVNPTMPHLICTAGNDQHLRIWDVRHFNKIKPLAADKLEPPAEEPTEGEVKEEERIPTYPTSSVSVERIADYLKTPKGKGLQRAAFQHGKSCSAAYWDPWGRRILSTSYDDKLRIWTLNPQSFVLDAPLPASHFKPSKVIPHNCQTGRWLTILRAQWSQNTDFAPHFTVGNMKRSLDVIAASGEKIVGLWADGVTAVPAVTASHPAHVDRVVGGNTSGKIQLWTSGQA